MKGIDLSQMIKVLDQCRCRVGQSYWCCRKKRKDVPETTHLSFLRVFLVVQQVWIVCFLKCLWSEALFQHVVLSLMAWWQCGFSYYDIEEHWKERLEMQCSCCGDGGGVMEIRILVHFSSIKFYVIFLRVAFCVWRGIMRKYTFPLHDIFLIFICFSWGERKVVYIE